MENKIDLLSGNIIKVLTKLSFPIMVASFLRMTYSLVDMMWIGRISADASAAVGAAAIILWFVDCFGMLGRNGANIKVGHALGLKDLQLAKSYVVNGIIITALISLITSLALIFGKDIIIDFFNFNNITTKILTSDYLLVMAIFLFASFFASYFSGIFTADGDSKTPFYASFIGLVSNIILDPIFIFGFGLGVKGAAMASVIAQVIVLVFYLIKIKKITIFQVLKWELDVEKIGQIVSISFPLAVQSMIFSALSIVLSRFVAQYSDAALAAQRIGVNIESLSWMMGESFSVALSSFVAQNYSARNYQRIFQGFRFTVVLIFIWSIFTTLLLYLLPNHLMNIFTNDAMVKTVGISYLTIIAYSQIFMCVELIISSLFYGFGKTKFPAMVSIICIGLRLPISYYIAVNNLSLDYIWYTFTGTTILLSVVMIIGYLFLRKKYQS